MMIHPIDNRYGSVEMRKIFDEEERLNKMLLVEGAIAKAHSQLGHIPKESGEEIYKKANTNYVSLERMKEIENEINHDIMALVLSLSEQCGEHGKYVHLGATSNDINDSATALQFVEAFKIIFSDLLKLEIILMDLSKKYRDTVCVGRTHGQHAIPTTYGMKFAIYLDEIRRSIDRLEFSYSNVCGKISGAVGTMASYKDGPEMQKKVGEILGIKMAKISNQVVSRDIYADVMFSLASLASTLDKIALEIRNLQRTEIMEIAEGFGKKQVGSSTMPNKKNPVTCEKICGLARVIYSNVFPALMNNPLWHERDLTNSSCERVIHPESFILIDEMLKGMIKVLSTLVFNEANIKKNLGLTGYSNLAEVLMLKLVEKGMGRQDAHETMRVVSMKDGLFIDNVKQESKITDLLSNSEIDAALNPENYIGYAKQIVDDVIGK
ncbi:MAG TPA: adenylosuccinate lyase [Methanofastidiosum sp.]|nr:adenylosuccinate lyase [Methanofastidiosum sp.]HPA48947.1 adenylosuccinate lyase [Methanofastidiosum sp.]HQK62130.1 adenylosuccinate lyase [Methanofastidiosum sp.]HQM94309.1 adenylosuccinate lyase [Methanofastidiosum sp.]HQQ48382.1 adenylosuccinate lyase [Methanofastidiosum sp.]